MTVRDDLLRPARAEVVRAGDVGPANWLALDAFHALTRGASEWALSRIEANGLLARGFGDDETASRCRDVMVTALLAAGRLDESARLAEELIEQYASTGQDAARLQVLGQLITTRFARGEFERALDELTAALASLSRLRGHSRAIGSAFLTVANAASSAEMFELAASQLRRAVEISRAVGNPFLSRMVDGTTARNEIRWAARLEMIDRPLEAAARYREALRAAVRAQAGEPTNHWQRIGRLYEGFAWVALDEPALGKAALLDSLGRDGALSQPPFEPEDTLVLRLGLARACTALGQLDESRAHLQATAGLRDATFSHQWQVGIVMHAAEIERVEHGDHPAATLAYHAARLLARSLWEERERRLESVMVRTQMLELVEENQRVGQAATEDPLTGLGNRRKLDAALQELADVNAGPACLLFVDLDRFKHINDSYSHAIGDEVLKALADILRRESREHDVVARYGGDEFVVLLRGSPLVAGARVAERIRAAVATHPWQRLAPGLAARVSVGVAEHRPGMTYDEAIVAADSALYEAKQRGRDRVAVA